MPLINDSKLPDYFPQALIDSAKVIALQKNERLFLNGDRVDGIYYILEGELKAMRPMLKEGDVVMARARQGDYFAVSALTLEYFTCDGICVNSAEVLSLPKKEVINALKTPTFALGFSLALATNARRQCNRYERLRLQRSRDRLLHYLTCESDQSGQLNWHLPLTELASELAIEPETLYRTMADLEKEGTISRDKRAFQLLRCES